MRSLLIFFSSIILCSCPKDSPLDNYLEECTLEVKYGLSHYLKVPITITPNKKNIT